MKTIILITFLLVSINSRTVYMCHDDPFKDEQCMKKETLGSVDFVWVRKCKGAKVCVDLPYYNEIIGACSIKVRSHYDGESCANGNKCTSGICGGTKCKGLNPGVACEVGLGQCKKGYLCRKVANDDGTVDSTSLYRCQKPLEHDKNCENFIEYPVNLKNSHFIIYDYDFYFDPAYNPCVKDDVCAKVNGASEHKCVKIGDIESGKTSTHPLACSTGIWEGSTTIGTTDSGKPFVTSSGTCKDADSISNLNLQTSRGGAFTNYKNISDTFDKWKKEWGKKNIKDDDFIYEAYRYTKNKKKINEYFYQYTHAAFVQDADECAYDYMWKQSSSNSLKFSLMILILALLF